APSSIVVDKFRKLGWAIPADPLVLHNISATTESPLQAGNRRPIKEIVFFGRLEVDTELLMFCRTLDRLKYQLRTHNVTFLNRCPGDETSAMEFLIKR